MKTDRHVEGSAPRRKKATAAKRRSRAAFIGTRPLKFPVTLRGQLVEVEVLPAVGTLTHVHYEITVSLGGKVLDWALTRPELERIGHAAGMHTERQTSH